MGAEPVAALDLADTLITVADPPTDLLADEQRALAWWRVQARRLPEGAVPELGALRRLRAAVRELVDARLAGRSADPVALEDLNATASSVPVSVRLGADLRSREVRWHTEYGGNAGLAAIATGAIELLGDPAASATLRRCANRACSMVFLATNRRRVWCTPNICGNRARVARHYERTRRGDASAAPAPDGGVES
jgi:predicted RNA-binding Zn ribbon-like protein